VWKIRAALLVGFLFLTAGDILFAYFTSIQTTALDPPIDLMFLVGYFFAACGMKLEHEPLTE
jgi:hypothetical protein